MFLSFLGLNLAVLILTIKMAAKRRALRSAAKLVLPVILAVDHFLFFFKHITKLLSSCGTGGGGSIQRI